jgi:hypothetical protein
MGVATQHVAGFASQALRHEAAVQHTRSVHLRAIETYVNVLGSR